MQNVLGTKGTTYSIDTVYCIRSTTKNLDNITECD